MEDPSAKSAIRSRQSLIDTARSHLNKRRAEARLRVDEARLGPQGETRSENIVRRVELVPLDRIYDDPDFENLRQKAEEEDLVNLSESMKHEGLKVPITVVEAEGAFDGFYVRAGFRRTEVARRLRWEKIPAVVLPNDTPVIEEYWTNIIENSARSKLSTYEIASAANTMRTKFKIKPREFAVRAGYSESYVVNLLRCLDRLPSEIVDEWKQRAPIPVDNYIAWSKLEPDEAIKMMFSYTNRHPRIVKEWKPSEKAKERVSPIRMASSQGLTRMQRLRFAVEVTRGLTDHERKLCLSIIDFCSGAKNDVAGIYDSSSKQRIYKSRRVEDVQVSLAPELE